MRGVIMQCAIAFDVACVGTAHVWLGNATRGLHAGWVGPNTDRS